MASQLVLPRQTGELITIPAETWRAGPAARAAAAGRLAPQVEAIAQRGASLLRLNPALLRRVGRLGGGVLAPLLFLEAVEWASEWIRDGLIPSLMEWSRPTTTGTFRLGYRFSYEYLDYGPLGFPSGTPTLLTQTTEVLPTTGIGSLISIDQPPVYKEEPGFGSVGWRFTLRTTKQGGTPNFEESASSFWAKARYRFVRVVSWEILGIPTNVPVSRELYDPEQGPRPSTLPAVPGAPPVVPLDLPAAPPFPLPIPGDLTVWTPATRGVPGERYDLDWVPRRQNRPDLARAPGLRVGFRPWGVILAELAVDLIGDAITDPPNGDGDGDCPDPCPDPCPPIDWEQVRPIIQEELDEKFPPRRPIVEDSISYPPSASRDIALPSFPRRAVLTCTERPSNTRYQPGGGSAPDVFYLGWYSVGRGAEAGERKPIHYLNQSINLQPGDTTLTYTYYAGTLGSCVVHFEREV